MSSRPLVILHQDADLAPYVMRFEELKKEQEKFFEQLQIQFVENMKRIELQKAKDWEELEDLLLKKNLIDTKDVSLSYKSGVVYIDGIKEENINGNILKDIINKFITK